MRLPSLLELYRTAATGTADRPWPPVHLLGLYRGALGGLQHRLQDALAELRRWRRGVRVVAVEDDLVGEPVAGSTKPPSWTAPPRVLGVGDLQRQVDRDPRLARRLLFERAVRHSEDLASMQVAIDGLEAARADLAAGRPVCAHWRSDRASCRCPARGASGAVHELLREPALAV